MKLGKVRILSRSRPLELYRFPDGLVRQVLVLGPIYLTFRVLGSRVFGAKMSCKIFIAPLLVVPLHFIERITGGCSRRIEHPCAFGATPAHKTLFFDPYQFAAHGLPRRTSRSAAVLLL
jgi:hypothetical protein